MKNDPTSNNAMARVYRTAVAVSALIISTSVVHAADPPVPRGNVSTTVNPTTGYHVVNNTTLRLPNGVSVAPTTSGGLPVVSKYPAGLQQTIPSGITIDAIKKTAPLSLTVRATTQSVKGAATRCLTSAKCNVALLLAGAGLEQLFDGLDWVMGDGGKIQKNVGGPEIGSNVYKPSDTVTTDTYGNCSTGQANCIDSGLVHKRNGGASRRCLAFYNGVRNGSPVTYHLLAVGYASPTSYVPECFYGLSPVPESYAPVPNSEIESGVQNKYIPEPSDWRALTPELNPDDIEITWAPTLQGEPKTETEYDADGNPHRIRETNIWYDFDIRDNPSPQPKLDVKKREETKTFEDGVLTGTTTTNSTESAGSDDTPPPPPESPIDCDLFPTACAWFEWTQEEPIEPDDDFSPLLQEVPIVSETYTITGGVAACPAPLVLDLSVFGSREVSYQPLCDLASTMKFLYLALMSFAAAVLLNRSISRV